MPEMFVIEPLYKFNTLVLQAEVITIASKIPL